VISLASVPQQDEAKRLLEAALAEGPAHAYLFHGPGGVGKRTAALAFAAELLGDPRRVEAGAHPDLYRLEALGEMIRIDEIRSLRRDLHMRPFEADRRVYLILDAHLLNDDATDALLKDLEEPPPYAVIVLVADELGPLPETIRSRCQLVPFRRLSEGAVRAWIAERAPSLAADEVRALARVAGGRLDRAGRLLDPAAEARRQELLAAARGPYLDPGFEPADAAAVVLAAAAARGSEAKEREAAAVEGLDLTAREAEQRVRRAQRGAERDELLAALDELSAWYRDLVVVSAGAESAVVHADRLTELRDDAALGVGAAAERAAELTRAAWRAAEEFNVNASLALEALFVRLRRELASAVAASRG
jgi:DNA polymerase-3 subunit delta'